MSDYQALYDEMYFRAGGYPPSHMVGRLWRFTPHAPGSIVDVGCGHGTLRRLVWPGTTLYGVDVARAALENAARVSPVLNCLGPGCCPQDTGGRYSALALADLTRVPFGWPPFKADTIFCAELLEHFAPADLACAMNNILALGWDTAEVNLSISCQVAHADSSGRPLHLTVRPAEWWLERLRGYLVVEKEEHDQTMLMVAGTARPSTERRPAAWSPPA